MLKNNNGVELSNQSLTDSANFELTTAEFKTFQKFLYECSGIVLNDNKRYLLKSRLSGLLRNARVSSLSALIASLETGNVSDKIRTAVIDAMTTNETYWFRDTGHFDELKSEILPALLRRKSTTPRFWSAACSTGQEPYSISICVEDYLRGLPTRDNRNIQVIGTDICASVLAEASRATYSEMAISRGVESPVLARYFHPTADGWKLKHEITERVRFQQFNLLKPFSALGRFDVIFCRNVLIYFSDERKKEILGRMSQVLNPGGYLFLSSTESMIDHFNVFEPIRSGLIRYYRLKD